MPASAGIFVGDAGEEIVVRSVVASILRISRRNRARGFGGSTYSGEFGTGDTAAGIRTNHPATGNCG